MPWERDKKNINADNAKNRSAGVLAGDRALQPEHAAMKTLSRITLDPAVIGGKACVRGMRVTVGTIVGLLASGHSPEAILEACPCLEREDVDQSPACAAWRLEEREVPIRAAAMFRGALPGPAHTRIETYLMVVNSSIPQCPPSRPTPLSPTPPIGTSVPWGRRSFTPTKPQRKTAAVRNARARSRV